MGDQKVVQDFIKVLLQWDYEDLFEKFGQGEGIVDELIPVPRKFKDLKEYQMIFEQMIMEETLAQLMQGSEALDLITAQPAVLKSSSHVSGFLEAQLLLGEEHAQQFSHADLLIIDRTNPVADDNAAALFDHAVGHTEGRDGSTVRVKFFLETDALAGQAKAVARMQRMARSLMEPMGRWWVMRLGNIATVSREWAATKRLEFLPMRDMLLQGGTRQWPVGRQMQVPGGLMQRLRQTFNSSQLEAVTAGLDGRPFVLIQGPPGTGKTQTILGLLSVLKNTARKGTVLAEVGAIGAAADDGVAGLTTTLRAWQLSAPWLTAAPHASCVRSRCRPSCSDPGSNENWYGFAARPPVVALGRSKLTKSRILVCAPSNAALDEIVLRVLRNGLLSGAGVKVMPNIVRAGVSARMHASVSGVTLDSLVAAAVGATSDYHVRDAAALRILNNADVVFSTLAFTGSSVFKKVSVPFDTVVIDEAAQALEPSCLVPLSGSVKQVYMVGDPIQLPATVMSKRAVQANYQQSLFKRLQDTGYPVHVLQVQYRMNPLISRFASDTFYEGKIQDGPNVLEGTKMPYHQHPGLGPIAFYHVKGEEYNPEGSASICNDEESNMVLALIKCLIQQHAALAKEPLIGVISPYKAQVRSIKTKLQEAMPSASERIDVNTIDGFQGREKDVIIFSTVRTFAAKKNKKIGFVADERRVNVGLTRARCSLIVVGQRFVLQRDDNWEALLQFVSERGTLYDAKPKFESFMASVLSGKAPPATFTPKPKEPTVFIPSAGDDNELVSRKRTAAGPQRRDKRQRR